MRNRRSIRLKDYDYTKDGYYFITVCTYKQEYLLGECLDGSVILSRFGKIVERCWQELPSHFAGIDVSNYIIMPNHIHGIIKIFRGEALEKSEQTENTSFPRKYDGTKSGSLGAIIQNFKSVSTRKFNKINGSGGMKLWQRNYYEHIIRNEEDFNRICLYIKNNPAKWTRRGEAFA